MIYALGWCADDVLVGRTEEALFFSFFDLTVLFRARATQSAQAKGASEGVKKIDSFFVREKKNQFLA